MNYTLQSFGQHVLTNFGLAQAVGKNSFKNEKVWTCYVPAGLDKK